MAPNYLALYGSFDPRRRYRFALGPQTAGDLVEIGLGETGSGAQQNPIARFFDGELRTRSPGSGSPHGFGQHDLTLGGEPGGFHR